MDRDLLLGIAMMALLLLVAVSIALIAWGSSESPDEDADTPVEPPIKKPGGGK